MLRNGKRFALFFIGLLFVVLLAVPANASENFAILKLEQRGANYVFLEWDEYADGLTSIALPATVTSIGTYVFNGCDKLATVTMQEGVTSIGKYAFCNCTCLTSITIPDSVTSIGSSAFSGCSSSLIIYCSDDSYAATYADANGFTHQQP